MRPSRLLLGRRQYLFRVVLRCSFLSRGGRGWACCAFGAVDWSAVHLPVGIVEHPGGLREVDQVDVLAHEFGDDLADVVHLGERLEQGNHLEQAPVVRVVVPRQDRHRVLVVKVVRVGRVVDNDNVFHVAPEEGQVLDVAALEAEAVLTVQPHRDQLVLVQRIH